MGGIRFSGMASGLPPNIVEQLMEAERIPIKNIETQKTKTEDKLKLVTDLETKISEINKTIGGLTNRKGFVDKKMTSGFPDIINGNVDPEVAESGEWNLEVVQLAERPVANSTAFPDKDKTKIGTGYIKFETEQGEKEVYITNEGSTLEKVAETINRAEIGATAIVVNDRSDKENPFKLQVSGLKSGDDNQVKFPIVYFLDGDQDFLFDKMKPAVNAKFKLDGMEYETASNQVSDLLPGVSLDLKRAAPGQNVRLNVTENWEVIGGKVKAFVDAYNAALGFVQGQNKITNTGKNPQLGPLGGDGMLRTVESRLRSIIQDPQYTTGSSITRINDLGIEFARNGTLNFNQEKFNKVLTGNPTAVVGFLRGDGVSTGFMPTVKRGIDVLLNAQFGAIGTRKKNYGDRIGQMNERIDNKERQLSRKEDSLRKKFSDLESQMSKLQSQGAGLSAAGLGGGKQG